MADSQSLTQRWAAAVAPHIDAVEAGQASLRRVLERKRLALAAGDVAAIDEACETEQRLIGVFADLAAARDGLLKAAGAEVRTCHSLAELADVCGLSDVLCERIERSRRDAESLRNAAVTQHLVAGRTARHYEGLIDLIASAGRESESYGQAAESGGGLLNAEA